MVWSLSKRSIAFNLVLVGLGYGRNNRTFFYSSIAHNATSWNDLVLNEMTLKRGVEESNRAIASTAEGGGKNFRGFAPWYGADSAYSWYKDYHNTRKMEERN